MGKSGYFFTKIYRQKSIFILSEFKKKDQKLTFKVTISVLRVSLCNLIYLEPATY